MCFYNRSINIKYFNKLEAYISQISFHLLNNLEINYLEVIAVKKYLIKLFKLIIL